MNVPERKGNYSAKKSKYQGKYKDKYNFRNIFYLLVF